MFFKFVSGNNLSSALNIDNYYYKNNRIPIINYMYENINNNIYNIVSEYEKYINYLINKCIIDAEDNKNINIYRNIVNKLIYKYNY